VEELLAAALEVGGDGVAVDRPVGEVLGELMRCRADGSFRLKIRETRRDMDKVAASKGRWMYISNLFFRRNVNFPVLLAAGGARASLFGVSTGWKS
jgi:hypothetical protein